LEGENFGGDALELAMSNVAALLKRKQTLLDRMHKQSEPSRVAEIRHELQEIDEALNRIESGEFNAPIAPK
jgi:hypothetical protein